MQCVAVSAQKRFRQCVAEEIPADNIFLSRIAQVAMLCLSAANPRIAFGKLQRGHFAFSDCLGRALLLSLKSKKYFLLLGLSG